MSKYELKINNLDSMIFNSYADAVNERDRRERIRQQDIKNGKLTRMPSYEIRAID